MTAADSSSWVSIIALASIAVVVSILFIRLRAPWYVGAPLAGLISISLFETGVAVLLGQDEKFLYVALAFGAIYATGFALVPYVARAVVRGKSDRHGTS
jgi:hypothetical protein